MARTRAIQTGWPEGFELTPLMEQFAKERGFDPVDEFDDFKDWCAANPAKARYADWPAAFRTRIRNKTRWGGKPESRRIGFTATKATPPAAVMQALRDNELAEQETRDMTIEQRREAGRKFAEMIGKIK